MGDILTREAILQQDDIPTETVDVPEWGGGTVRLRGFTAGQYEAWDPTRYDEPSLRARLVFLSAVNEAGERLFTDEADVAALNRKNPTVIRRLARVVARLSGLGEYAEELRGNSGAGQPGGSSSSSPASSGG